MILNEYISDAVKEKLGIEQWNTSSSIAGSTVSSADSAAVCAQFIKAADAVCAATGSSYAAGTVPSGSISETQLFLFSQQIFSSILSSAPSGMKTAAKNAESIPPFRKKTLSDCYAASSAVEKKARLLTQSGSKNTKKTLITAGHLKITDHLILGITRHKLKNNIEKFNFCDLETKAFTGWNEVGEALAQKEINAACILAPYAMELFHSGADINLILFSHKMGSTIVSSKKAGIKTVQDFRGKTVLIPYHQSVHHMLFDMLVTKAGLSTGAGKDVVFEVAAPSQIPEMMEWDEDGTIGGFIVAEPFGTQVIKKGLGEEFILTKKIWPDHPCCVVVVSGDLIRTNPEAVHELTASLVASGNFVTEHPREAAQIGADFLSQEYDIVYSVLSHIPKKITTTHLMPVIEDLEKMQNYMTSSIDALSGKIDLSKFVDTRFAAAAGAR